MPYRRKTAKRKPKKRLSNYVPRTIKFRGPLTKTLKSTLVYSDIYRHTSGIGFPLDLVWNLNSLYDPDSTGAGHQPRGFDQLIALYDHYVVIGANVDIKVSNQNVNNSVTAVASIRDNNLAINTINDHLEAQVRNVVLLPPEGTGGSVRNLNFNVNTSKFLGRPNPLSDPQLKGSASSNPTEACYLHFAFCDSAQAATVICDIVVTITYTAVFIEPKDVAQS